MRRVIIKSKVGEAIGLIRDEYEYLQSFWARGEFYESEMLEYIQAKYSGGMFIDVGSCIGNHTLFFAKFCNCVVMSIEPVYDLLLLQAEVLEENKLMNSVFLNHHAVGRQVCTCWIRNTEKERNAGMAKAFSSKDPDISDNKYTEVQMHTLDSRVLPRLPVTLLKIDVEGLERDVLLGAKSLISLHKPAIFIEIIERKEATIRLLKQYGYKHVRQFEPFQTWEFVYNG